MTTWGEWTTYALIASLAKSMSMQTLWPVKVCFRCCPTALQSIAIQEYQPSSYTKSVPMNRFGFMKTIDPAELDYLSGTRMLVVNALRQKPHHSHQTVSEAVDFAHLVGASQTWLIHSSHDIGRHAEVNAQLPSDIQLAYDGQVIEL